MKITINIALIFFINFIHEFTSSSASHIHDRTARDNAELLRKDGRSAGTLVTVSQKRPKPTKPKMKKFSNTPTLLLSARSKGELPSGNRVNSMRYHMVSTSEETCSGVVESAEHCPYVAGYNGNINSTSRGKDKITPWVLRNDYDVNRLPHQLSMACCACLHCVDMTDGHPKPMHDHYSEPVTVPIRVFTWRSGAFVPKTKTLFVGCTCTYDRTF